MQSNFDHIGKVPPQATDLEEAVLGAIMIDSDAIIEVADILTAEMFYKDENRIIFTAIEDLYRHSKSIDLLTVTERIKAMGELKSSLGPFYITSLTNRVASAAHVANHALIIRQKFIRRSLITLSAETTGKAYDDSIDDLEVLEIHEKGLERISSNATLTSEKNMVQVLTSILSANNEAKGIQVTNPASNVIHSYGNSDLIILAARPSMGKTAYALQIAKDAAKLGNAVAVFSLEMSSDQLGARMLCNEAEVYLDKILTHTVHEYDQAKYREAISTIEGLPIYIDDTAALSIYEMRSRCARLKRKYGIGMVVVDYIQLMRGESSRNGNREQEIASISRGLKVIAKNLNIPVIALSQLSRKCEERSDKRPMLSDLRESGAIEQDADVVQFLYRPEYYGIGSIITDDGEMSSAGIAEIITAKNRNGGTGSSFATWSGQFMKFGHIQQMSRFVPVAKVTKGEDAPF